MKIQPNKYHTATAAHAQLSWLLTAVDELEADWLGEVGQVLHHFGDEGEGTWRLLVGILLGEVEERRRHDGRTQEAQEERAADEAVGDILPTPLSAADPPRSENLLQLSREHAMKRQKTFPSCEMICTPIYV